jgi:hypothetical protein
MGELTTLPKNDILDLLLQGKSEFQACEELGIPMLSLIDELLVDSEFADKVAKARNIRADRWVNGITQLILTPSNTPIIHDKDDVPGVKLAIDTFKWLAKIDNPTKYGDKLDINVEKKNIYEIKGLSVAEALDIIKSDPFAPKEIDAEYVVLEKDREDGQSSDEDML